MTRAYYLLVDNKPGVLDRIAGVIRRYGWNICALTASEADEAELTHVTLSIRNAQSSELPDEKLAALDFVRRLEPCDEGRYTLHEMMVARGSSQSLKGHLDAATQVVEKNGTLTAYWVGSPEEIGEIHDRLNTLSGVYKVRAGSIALTLEREE